MNMIAVAETAEAALEKIPELDVYLVLVDHSLPDMSGVSLLEALLAEHPDLRCAMLSGHLSLQHARRALELGARGYMIKDDPLRILDGIPRILKGEIYVSDELLRLGVNDFLTNFS